MSAFRYVLQLPKSSKIVYFSGPDGAGKTTTILWAIEYLEKLNVKYCRTKNLQLWMLYFLNARYSKVEAVSATQVVKDEDLDLIRDRSTGKFSWHLRRRIGLIVGLMEISLVGRFFLMCKSLTGHVILVEESPVDIFVKRHRPRVKILENIFVPLLPSPTTSILCVANEQVIFERKPELTREEIDEYYRNITYLYKKNNKLSKVDIHTDTSIIETQSSLVHVLDELF